MVICHQEAGLILGVWIFIQSILPAATWAALQVGPFCPGALAPTSPSRAAATDVPKNSIFHAVDETWLYTNAKGETEKVHLVRTKSAFSQLVNQRKAFAIYHDTTSGDELLFVADWKNRERNSPHNTIFQAVQEYIQTTSASTPRSVSRVETGYVRPPLDERGETSYIVYYLGSTDRLFLNADAGVLSPHASQVKSFFTRTLQLRMGFGEDSHNTSARPF